MSYDLHLIPKRRDVDILSAARALLDREEQELNPEPPVPQKEARKARLADALMKASPQLSASSSGTHRSRLDTTSRRRKPTRYRHIELNGPEDGNGIQITLSDDTVAITIPYWHQPAAPASVFDDVWRYLAL
jgi:hypothetical protein